MLSIKLNSMERDAILAGLRLLQTNLALPSSFLPTPIGDIWRNGRVSGLSREGIDRLCERINA